MTETYTTTNQLAIEQVAKEDSYDIRPVQQNCSFATLGKAACITCAAAPDCPLLKLRQARAEQTPDPERTTYLDSLLDDTSDDLVVAGYRTDEGSEATELSSVPPLTVPDYTNSFAQPQQAQPEVQQTQKPQPLSLLDLLQQAEVLAQPQATDKPPIVRHSNQELPLPPTHNTNTIQTVDTKTDTKITQEAHKQSPPDLDSPPLQAIVSTAVPYRDSRPSQTSTPNQKQKLKLNPTLKLKSRRKAATQELPRREPYSKPAAIQIQTPVQQLNKRAVPTPNMAFTQPNPVSRQKEKYTPNTTKEMRKPTRIATPRAASTYKKQPHTQAIKAPQQSTYRHPHKKPEAAPTPTTFSHKLADAPTAHTVKTPFLQRPQKVLDFFSRITELSTSVPPHTTEPTIEKSSEHHNTLRHAHAIQANTKPAQEIHHILQHQHEQSQTTSPTTPDSPSRKAPKLPTGQSYIHAHHKYPSASEATPRTPLRSLSHYPEQFARANRPARFSLHTAVEALAAGVQRILQSLFA